MWMSPFLSLRSFIPYRDLTFERQISEDQQNTNMTRGSQTTFFFTDPPLLEVVLDSDLMDLFLYIVSSTNSKSSLKYVNNE